MKILLRKGEHLWTPKGTHVWCDKGFAKHCQEDTEVTFESQAIADEAVFFIKQERRNSGLDEETGLAPIIAAIQEVVASKEEQEAAIAQAVEQVTPVAAKKKRKAKQ
jgi:hypothetical protein